MPDGCEEEEDPGYFLPLDSEQDERRKLGALNIIAIGLFDISKALCDIKRKLRLDVCLEEEEERYDGTSSAS